MPASTRGKPKTLVFVKTQKDLAYGFLRRNLAELPGISEQELNKALGHMTYGSQALTQTGALICIVGANAPKPARAKKKLTDGHWCSTFIGQFKQEFAQTQGWIVGPEPVWVRGRIPKSTDRTVDLAVFLSNGEVKVWKADPKIATPERLFDLGLDLAHEAWAPAQTRLTKGSNSRPGIVEFEVATGKASLPFSTDPSRYSGVREKEEYRVIQEEKVNYPPFSPPF